MINRYVSKGFADSAQGRRMGLIQVKKPVVVDLFRSGGGSSVPERLILPRVQDVLQGARMAVPSPGRAERLGTKGKVDARKGGRAP